MGKPSGLPSMRSHRVGHDRSDLAAAAARLMSLSIFYTASSKSQLNADQRLISKVKPLETAVPLTLKPDYSEEVIPFATHREKGNSKSLSIIHSS